MSLIELNSVSKFYGRDESKTVALESIQMKVEVGEFISIMGPSGSGKSTLLNILGCMDVPSVGEYSLKGRSLKGLDHKELSHIRNKVISFVFQHFALLKNYSVYENVELPLLNRKLSTKEKREKIFTQLEKLGINKLYKKHPTQLSGGQQQRVAIARALVSDAEIILADEPTGALDQKTGRELLELLSAINENERKTIIVVTHDDKVAQYTSRIISINDGRIAADVANSENPQDVFKNTSNL